MSLHSPKIQRLAVLGVLALMVCSVVAVLLASRVSNVDHEEVERLMTTVADESALVTNDYLARVETSARLVAGSLEVFNDQPDQLEEFFASLVDQSPNLDGVYIGRSDGTFDFLARWTGPDADAALAATQRRPIQALRARHISLADDGTRVVEQTWFDDSFETLAPTQVEPAEYDPRLRPWFGAAVDSATAESWNDPYVFASSGKIGITYSVVAPNSSTGATQVVGADVVLDELIGFLNERVPSEHSRTAVLGPDGTVLASSDMSSADDDPPTIDPRIVEAVRARASAKADPRVDSATASTSDIVNLDDTDSSIAAITPVGSLDKWFLVVVSPEADFATMRSASATLAEIVVPALAALFLISVIAATAGYVTRLRLAARVDDLTQVSTRYEANRRLTMLLERGQTSGIIAIVDLDGFKAVNDELGHATGDYVLKLCAQRIAAEVSDRTVLGRLGGDEFMLAVPIEDDPMSTLQRILTSLAQPIIVNDRRITLSGSIGATVHQGGQRRGLTSLLREADVALYGAKRAGGNSIRLYDQSMHPSTDPDRVVIDASKLVPQGSTR